MTEQTSTNPGPEVETAEARLSEALRSGAEAGSQAVNEVWRAAGKLVSSTLYGGCYYLAYGTTFAALTVAGLLPANSSITKGLHDGADAARHIFEGWEPLATVSPEPTEAEQVQTAEPGEPVAAV
jgi:hypothetical protein